MDMQQLYKLRFLENSKNENIKKKNLIWRELCKHFLDKFIPSNSTIVEFGAGYCEFINNIALNTKFHKKIAIDINEDVKKFADASIEVYHDDYMNITSIIKNSVDIVFISNFLEHMQSKNDILCLFAECHRILRNNGKILILQPNINLIGGAYWDFIDHHIPLTEKSLQEALKLTGYKIDKCITRFLPYTTKSVFPQHPLFVRLYLYCPWAWFFLGKQSFIVATPDKYN